MRLLDVLKKHIHFKDLIIGIGLGKSKLQNINILTSAVNFTLKHNIWIFLFGTKGSIKDVKSSQLLDIDPELKVKLIGSDDPEKEMLEYAKKKEINAIVRGSFKSSTFLSKIKTAFEFERIYRLALLETAKGIQFFYGPVGIDECNDVHDKKKFVKKSLELFKKFEIEPIISILSGGRLGDAGRDKIVDETMEDAKSVVEYFIKQAQNLKIYHDEILIENSIKRNSNLILAPNGISGNLIYRTLVHLGDGKSYGAFFLGSDFSIIDTSRVAPKNELDGAFYMAAAMYSIV